MTSEARSLGTGDRLSSDPSERMASLAFGGELDAADLLHPALGFADVAHVVALTTAGIVPRPDARRLVAGLRRLGERSADEIAWDPVVGDVYNNREALLRDDIGEIAGWLSTGRARREATTVAWLLVVRERHLSAAGSAATLLRSLVELATAHRDSLMTDYTYLQHAQPTTLGHYLLSHAYPVARDADRLLAGLEEVDASPAGSGSVNGSRFPIDRQLLATLLGFPRTRDHTRDAMWPSDVAVRPGQAVTAAAVSLDRLVAELLLFATREFGFVELADRHTRTSVIMPQKKNPYALTQVRGLVRELVATAGAVTLTQLTPTGQPDNRTTAYEQVPRMLGRLGDAHLLVSEVVDGLAVDVDALRRSAADDFTASTDLCDLMTVELGLTNRVAHRIVGRAVRSAVDDGVGTIDRARLVDAGTTLGVDLTALDADAVAACNDPAALVALRRTTGGAAPEPMDAMLAILRRHAEDVERRVAARRSALDGFDATVDELLQEVDPT